MADIQANIGIGVDTSQALAAIRQLQREISAFHTSMAKGGALANAESMRMQQNLINTINATGQFSAGMSKISSSTESFTNALEKNKLSMGQYFRYAGGASATFGKMFSKEFNTINRVATERVKDLQTQYISMGRDANGALQSIKVRPLALDMDHLGTRVQLTAQKQQLFNQLMKQGSTNLLNFGKNTQWAGRQLMVGFTIPLTILGTTAAREFQKLEEQAIKFKRVYGDMFTTTADTEKALSNVRALADEFTKYGVAVEKTLGLAAEVAQMGAVGADLTAQVTQATRLAVLGGIEQEEALNTTISLTSAFGVASEDLAGKIAFLNAVENQTILSIEDFNEAIPKSGAVVKQLGGDVEDLAFFLTAMREGGINASESANALKSGLASIINPTQQSIDKMKEFGIDVVGVVDKNAGDLKGTVMSLAAELNGLGDLDRARAIEQLFGKFQFARISTLFQNITKQGTQAQRVLELTANSTEELAIIAERELSRVEDSVATKFTKQMESLQAALAPIGEEFMKAIIPVLEFGTKLLKSFNELGDGSKQFIVVLTAIAGVIAPAALMAFGLVANGVANLIKLFAFLGRGFGALSGQSTLLGTGTEYMTQQQIEAAAVAASLGQSHQNLIQVFGVEASALNNLANAYRQATIAQSAFRGAGTAATGARIPKPKGFADGGLIVGPGSGTSDSIPAMVSNGEFIMNAKRTRQYLPFLQLMSKGKIPGFASPDGASIVGSPGLSLAKQMSGVDKVTPKITKLATSLDNLIARIDRTAGPGAGETAVQSQMSQLAGVSTEGGFKSSGAYRQNLYKMSMQHPEKLHIESGQRLRAEDLAGRSSGAAGQVIDDWATVNPDKEIQLKSSYTRTGSAYANRMLSADTSERGMPAAEAQADYEKFGLSKWDDAIKAGGGDTNDQELMNSFSEYDQKMVQLQEEARNRQVKFFVDSKEDIEKIIKKEREKAAKSGSAFDEAATRAQYDSYERMDEEASSVLSPKAAAVRKRAIAKKKAARIPITQAEREQLDILEQSGTPEQRAAASRLKDKYKGGKDKLERDFSGGGQVFSEDGMQDSKDWEKGARKAKPKDPGDIARELAGRNSPHPEAFPDGVDDAKDYLRGQESVLGPNSDPYSGSNLAAPKPPVATGPASKSGGFLSNVRGKAVNVGNKAMDMALKTGPGKKAANYFAETSGGNITNSKGEIVSDFHQKSGPAGNIAGGIIPVRIVDDVTFHPDVQEALQNGGAQTEDLSESMKKVKKSTDNNTSATEEELKAAKRQKRASAAGKAFAGLGTATMVAGMATQVEGRVGEIAQQVVGPLAALSAIGPLLMALGPVVGSLVGVFGLALAGIISYNKGLEKARKEAIAFADAMGTGKNVMKGFSEFAGKATSSEIMERRKEGEQNPFAVQAGRKSFGENFFDSESGQVVSENIKKSLVEVGTDKTINDVYLQLGNAVATGALDLIQAQSIAQALAGQFDDTEIAIGVNGKLLGLVTGDGIDALKEPITIEARQKLVEDTFVDLEELLSQELPTYESVMAEQSEANVDMILGDVNPDDFDNFFSFAAASAGNLFSSVFTKDYWTNLGDNVGAVSSFEKNQRVIELTAEQVVALRDALESTEAQIDSITLSYQDKINEALGKGDTVLADQLQRELEANLLPFLETRKKAFDLAAAKIEQGSGEFSKSLKESLSLAFEGEDLARAEKLFKEIGDVGLSRDRELMLQYQLSTGTFTLSQIEGIIKDFDDRPEVVDKIIEIGIKTPDATEVMSIINTVENNPALQDGLVDVFSTENMDEFDLALRAYRAAKKVGSIVPFEDPDILINLMYENPEAMNQITADLDRLEQKAAAGPITNEFAIDLIGEEAFAAIKYLWDDLEEDDKKTALYTVITSLGVEYQDPMAGYIYGGGTVGSDDVIGSAARNAERAVLSSQFLPSTDDTGEGSSGGGGAAPEVDSLIKKLRDLRLATIDMKKGWEGMQQVLESVFAGGSKGIDVFEGLSSQIRRMGVGESLIEMIIGMDPDEYEKRKNELFVFDKAGNIVGTTAKLKNMNAAFNAIAIGEYINSQQVFIENTKNQFSAMNILIASGMSFVEAYEMVQDQALATAIAMGATRAEIEELIRITREMTGMREKYNKISAEEQAAKSVRETNKEFNNRVAVLKKLSKSQGKYTDEEINAILNDQNLATIFLNPNIDPKALSRALENARRQADLELRVSVSTEEGKEGLFNQLVSEVTDEFARQESRISIAFDLATEDDQDIVREAQNKIAAIQFAIDDYEAQLKGISDQEEIINDKYDDRFEALDKVAEANERVAASQKAQLNIADALSRGDIAAAAAAQQELRAQEAQNATESRKEKMEKQKEAELRSIRSQSGMSREEIEERVKSLQDEIFGIEEDQLEPAQERIRIAEYNRDLQLDALEISGRTRSEWEQIANQVDIATTNTEEFAKSVQRALALYDHFVNGKDLDLSLFGGMLEELESAGVNVSSQVSRVATTAVQGLSRGTQQEDPVSTNALNEFTSNAFQKFLTGGAQTLSEIERILVGIGPVSRAQASDDALRALTGGSALTQEQRFLLGMAPSPYAPATPPRPIPSSSSSSSGGGANPSNTNPANLAPVRLPSGGTRQPVAVPIGGGRYIYVNQGGMIKPQRFSVGGGVKGYSSGGSPLGSDTVPAMLTPGEFVVRKRAVQDFGMKNLEKINSGSFSGGSVYNYNLAVNVKSDADPDRIAKTVMQQIKRVDSQRVRGNRF